MNHMNLTCYPLCYHALSKNVLHVLVNSIHMFEWFWKNVLLKSRKYLHCLLPYNWRPNYYYLKCQLSLCMRKLTIWVLTRSDTNRTVQSLKMVRGWKFWIYYRCSENKSADQLRSNCEADLRLYFRLCRLLVLLQLN